MAETSEVSDEGTPDEQPHPEATQLHHRFIDDIVAQIRTGLVHTSVADGRQPMVFRPLGHGGESMVLTGMRLPLKGNPYHLPFVLKVGLHESSSEELEVHRKRMDVLKKYMRDEHWFPHEHAMLHSCDTGEQRLVIAQQHIDLSGVQRLCCGYAEFHTDWDGNEIGTVTDTDAQAKGLPLLPRTHPYVSRYERVNKHLVLDAGAEHDAPVGREEFLAVQQSRPLAAMMNAMRRDSGMRAVVRLLVERGIQYTEETGEIIDVLGEGDNVLFHRRNIKRRERWAATLLDPLHPVPQCLNRLSTALTRLSSPQPIGDIHADVLDALNGMNYVRAMNGLARALNIEKRVMRWRCHLSDMQKEMIDFPLILERCRAFGAESCSAKHTEDTAGQTMPVPAGSKWEIIRRKA